MEKKGQLSIKDLAKIQKAIPEELRNAPIEERLVIEKNGVSVNFYTYNLNETAIKSFKGAGAYWAMLKAKEHNKHTVVASSAGNHAQGVAFAASKLDMQAHIFMPEGTSPSKIKATRRLGREHVKITLEGENYDAAKNASEKFLAEHKEAVSIHPFDDEHVIEGQSIHFFEAIRTFRETHKQEIDFVLMGAGGGGLLAGSMKARNATSPQTDIIAVEADGADSVGLAVKNNQQFLITSPVNTYAQGTAVGLAGKLNYETIASETREGDFFETVNNGQIAVATNLFTELGRYPVETAGALGTAALMFSYGTKKNIIHTINQAKKEGRNSVNIINFITGGNITPEEQVQRKHEAEIYQGQRRYLEVEIPENQPGSLKKIANKIGEKNINIIEFKFSSNQVVSNEGGQVVTLGLQYEHTQVLGDFISSLEDEDAYRLNDISRSRAQKIANTMLEVPKKFEKKIPETPSPYHRFSIEIPQRPGALVNLLNTLPSDINIEFFRYEEKSPEEDREKIDIGFSGEESLLKEVDNILRKEYNFKGQAEVLRIK